MPVKVLIADDHALVRKGLVALLEKEPGIEAVAEAVNGLEAINLVREHQPDVVLMDLAMPHMNGIDATRKLVAEHPNIHIIILSMYSERRLVMEAIGAGARAYILKDCAFTELAKAIRAVIEGDDAQAVPFSGLIISDRNDNIEPSASSAFLSARERQVLQFIAEGKNTKEIAFQLAVSIKTVETHRQNIMEKLRIHSIAGLTRYAIREGISPL